jgi:hypothetical protein
MKTAIRISALAIFLSAAIHVFCDAPPDPAQLKDKITVKVGQELVITFRAEGDKLVEPKVVQKADDTQPNVSVSFTMEQGVRMLSIQNGFPRGLRLRCLAKLEGKKQYVERDIHPLFPNFSSTEAIAEPVEELVLFDFQLTNDKLPN